MKCEKCGMEILEGNLCENCKNNSQTIESQTPIIQVQEQNTNTVIPEQYDPVVNLMNETVNQTVNIEKSDLENSIPIGDNNGIPQTPVNENVVSVSPQPNVATQVSSNINENVAEPTQQEVQQQVQQPEVQQQTSSQSVQEVKKTKTSTIVIIAVAVSLVVLIIFFVLPMISSMKAVNGMFNQAKANTFVTNVQRTMADAKMGFNKDAMQSGGTGIIYTNMTDVNKEDGFVKEMDEHNAEGKKYYIEINRSGEYQKVVVFDDAFCYDSKNEEPNFDNKDVSIMDIYLRNNNDSHNGCTGLKPQK